MAEVLQAIFAAVSFEGFLRSLELLVLVFILRTQYDLKKQVNDLHVWHDQDDPRFPERKIWWSDPTIREALQEIVENGKETNKHLTKLEMEAAKATS